LSAVAEEHADTGLVVLAANAWDETPEELSGFVKKHNLKQRILLNASEVAKRYHVNGVPTTLWIDREGTVVATELGFKSASKLEEKTALILPAA